MTFFNSINDESLVNLIKEGYIGVTPTDTLLGLVCLAKNRDSVRRLYEIKSRQKKPGTIIAANIDQLVDLGIKKRYLKAVEQFWPNAISVVLPCSEELEYIHQGINSLAMRVVVGEDIVNLLRKTGPLLTTSANLPGQPEARSMNQAINYFGESVDFYVDTTIPENTLPSTIIKMADDEVVVLREGQVKIHNNGLTTEHTF